MLLQELSEAYGPSGAEHEVRDILARTIRDHVDDVRVDAIGNLIATKRSRGDTAHKPPRVMVAAHMDEVGLMITHIDKGGQLKFATVGGIDARLLLAKRVLVGPGRVPGVIGSKPIHLLRPDEEKRVPKIDQLAIDIGVTSREKAEGRLQVGDIAVFATRFSHLGGEDDAAGTYRLVKGKAFDDRAGCTVLASLLDEDYPVDLTAVFTVQEEVGLRGARVAGYAVEPDLAIVLEGTICNDLPKEEDVSPVTRIGAGPAISVADATFIANRQLVSLIVDTAKREGLPYQFKEPGLGGTDAGAISLTRAGVPSAAVSVPCRYIHGPAAVLSLDDLDHTVALMKATLKRLNEWAGRSNGATTQREGREA